MTDFTTATATKAFTSGCNKIASGYGDTQGPTVWAIVNVDIEALADMDKSAKLKLPTAAQKQWRLYVCTNLDGVTGVDQLKFDSEVTLSETACLSVNWFNEPPKAESDPKADDYDAELSRLVSKMTRGLEGKRKYKGSKAKLTQKIALIQQLVRDFDEVTKPTPAPKADPVVEAPANNVAEIKAA